MTWQQFYETVQRQQEWIEARQPAPTKREEQGFTDEDLKSAFPTDFKTQKGQSWTACTKN